MYTSRSSGLEISAKIKTISFKKSTLSCESDKLYLALSLLILKSKTFFLSLINKENLFLPKFLMNSSGSFAFFMSKTLTLTPSLLNMFIALDVAFCPAESESYEITTSLAYKDINLAC